METIPVDMIVWPLTVNIGGVVTKCESVDELKEVIEGLPNARISAALKEHGVNNYMEFMEYSKGVVPYLKGIEDLSLMAEYQYPYYAMLERNVVVSTSPEELSDNLIKYYKLGKPFTLVPAGLNDPRLKDCFYPAEYIDYMHTKGIFGITDFLRYTGGRVIYPGDESIVEQVKNCMPVDLPFKPVEFPLSIRIGSRGKRIFIEDTADLLCDLLVEAYKHSFSYRLGDYYV